SVTGLLDRLEDKGMVRRVRNPMIVAGSLWNQTRSGLRNLSGSFLPCRSRFENYSKSTVTSNW
ncbi:MAG: hypothetical protein ACXWPS_17880, partial [Ktedonobacteraceae bacterium]